MTMDVEQRQTVRPLGHYTDAPDGESFLHALYRKASFVHPIYHSIRAPVSRYQLKKRVASAKSSSAPLRLIIGASRIPYAGWIPTEVYNLNMLKEEDWARHFAPGTVDALLAEHVWEHLTVEGGLRAARMCHRFLKPGGYLRVAVPDGLFPSTDYIDYVRPEGRGAPPGEHKVLYTYQTFSALFREAGFDVALLEYWDDAGTFHRADWDPEDGLIKRSARFDPRMVQCDNGDAHPFTSIILDAIKRDA